MSMWKRLFGSDDAVEEEVLGRDALEMKVRASVQLRDDGHIILDLPACSVKRDVPCQELSLDLLSLENVVQVHRALHDFLLAHKSPEARAHAKSNTPPRYAGTK